MMFPNAVLGGSHDTKTAVDDSGRAIRFCGASGTCSEKVNIRGMGGV